MPCGCGACGASGPGGCGMGSMPTGGCPTMPTGCPMGGCPMGGCASADAKKRFGIQVSSGQFLLKELMYCIVWVWPLPSNSDHQDDITFLVGNPNLNLYLPMVVSNIFYVHPYLGGKIPIFDEHIFQRSCFNHQLVRYCTDLQLIFIGNSYIYIYHLQVGANGEWIRVVIQIVFTAGSSRQLR